MTLTALATGAVQEKPALWVMEWVVHAIAGSTVKLLARHERAGVVRTEVILP